MFNEFQLYALFKQKYNLFSEMCFKANIIHQHNSYPFMIAFLNARLEHKILKSAIFWTKGQNCVSRNLKWQLHMT